MQSSSASEKLVRFTGKLALTLAIFTYILMALGAFVRSIDGGLSCPDWPLCHGQYLPPFDPILSTVGPVPTPAQMNAEWFHRLVAGFVSIGLVALGFLTWKLRKPQLRKWMIVAFVLLAAQVVMGAATVYMKNIHYSVAMHLALATSLLLTISWIARICLAGQQNVAWFAGAAMPERLRKASWVALGVLFTTLMVGAIIAKTAGADLVCPSFPACGRDNYEGVGHLVGLQMFHRFLALGFLAWVLSVALPLRVVPELRKGAYLLLALTIIQVTLGVVNVFFMVPPAISTAHLATAVAMFVTLFHWSVPGKELA